MKRILIARELVTDTANMDEAILLTASSGVEVAPIFECPRVNLNRISQIRRLAFGEISVAQRSHILETAVKNLSRVSTYTHLER